MPVSAIKQLLDDAETAPVPAQTHYAPCGWRKTIFAILFLLLLPFTVSIPIVLAQRLMTGVWIDTWGFIVLGLGLFLITLLVLFELLYSLRAEVQIGEKAVRFTVPSGAAGLFPHFAYRTETVPYAEIARLEKVCEVRGGSLAPVLLNCTRIVRHDGTTVELGSCHEQNPDHTFPYQTISAEIARRAGVEIDNCGHIRQPRAFGLLQPGRPLGAPEPLHTDAIAKINRRHGQLVLLAAVTIAILLGLGIASDVWTHRAAFVDRPSATPVVYPGAIPDGAEPAAASGADNR